MNQIEPLHRETVRGWLADHLGPPTSEVRESHFWLVRGHDGYARMTVRWDGRDGGLQAWDTRNYRALPFDSLQGLEALIQQAATTPAPADEQGGESRARKPVPKRWARGVMAWLVGIARGPGGT